MVRAPATSFIVRVWPGDADDLQLRGEVEHIASGQKRSFGDAFALAWLIESWQRELQRDVEPVR